MTANKKILITAGPTWVALDSVRVISNIASGQTGILLAKKAEKLGAKKISLLLGAQQKCAPVQGIKIKYFNYYNELKKLLKEELPAKYDVIIHNAAVSDYAPSKKTAGKIKSGRKLKIELKPTSKIAKYIRKISPKAFLVLFKLENNITDGTLIQRARAALKHAKAQLIVANRLEPRYKAYILDAKKIYSLANSRKQLAERLFKTIP